VLFGLGADYRTVGLYTANRVAEISNGCSPASFRIDDVILEKFTLNETVLATLPSGWTLVDSVKKLIAEKPGIKH